MSIFIMEDVVYVFTVSLTIIVLKIYRIPKANLLDPSTRTHLHTYTRTDTRTNTHRGVARKSLGYLYLGVFDSFCA